MPRRQLLGTVAFLLACGTALAGCGAPKYQYVKSTSDGTYVRVPSGWKLYDEDALIASSSDTAAQKASFKKASWSVAFDSSPKPSLDHILTQAHHPSGLVQVRTLSAAERDTFSLSDLRSLLLPFDPLSDEAKTTAGVEVLKLKDVKRGTGLHGSELLFNIKAPDGTTLKWRQIALTDASVSKVHVLAISCDDECYAANEGVIDKIVASWKVTER
jgi:hypothetical protein